MVPSEKSQPIHRKQLYILIISLNTLLLLALTEVWPSPEGPAFPTGVLTGARIHSQGPADLEVGGEPRVPSIAVFGPHSLFPF